MALTPKQEKIKRKVNKAREAADEFGLKIVEQTTGKSITEHDIDAIVAGQKAWVLVNDILNDISWRLDSIESQDNDED